MGSLPFKIHPKSYIHYFQNGQRHTHSSERPGHIGSYGSTLKLVVILLQEERTGIGGTFSLWLSKRLLLIFYPLNYVWISYLLQLVILVFLSQVNSLPFFFLIAHVEYFTCCCSVAHSCLTLWDPMDCSTLVFPVLHHLLKLAQTHVHWVNMPSNHLILCHCFLLLTSIFPSIRIFSNESTLHIRWSKYWNFSFSISLSHEYSGFISFRIDCPCNPKDSQESSPTPQFKSINSLALSFLYSPKLTSIYDH